MQRVSILLFLFPRLANHMSEARRHANDAETSPSNVSMRRTAATTSRTRMNSSKCQDRYRSSRSKSNSCSPT